MPPAETVPRLHTGNIKIQSRKEERGSVQHGSFLQQSKSIKRWSRGSYDYSLYQKGKGLGLVLKVERVSASKGIKSSCWSKTAFVKVPFLQFKLHKPSRAEGREESPQHEAATDVLHGGDGVCFTLNIESSAMAKTLNYGDVRPQIQLTSENKPQLRVDMSFHRFFFSHKTLNEQKRVVFLFILSSWFLAWILIHQYLDLPDGCIYTTSLETLGPSGVQDLILTDCVTFNPFATFSDDLAKLI